MNDFNTNIQQGVFLIASKMSSLSVALGIDGFTPFCLLWTMTEFQDFSHFLHLEESHRYFLSHRYFHPYICRSMSFWWAHAHTLRKDRLQIEVSPRVACSGGGCGAGRGGGEHRSFTIGGKELENAERMSIDCKVPICSSTTELSGQMCAFPGARPREFQD